MGKKNDLVDYLILEVLVARCVRMGETDWPLPDSALAAVQRLERDGMVGWKGGRVDGTLTVWLTAKGRAEHAPLPLPDAQAVNLGAADRKVDDLLAHALDVLGDMTRDIARDGEPTRVVIGMADAIGEARSAWRNQRAHADHVHVAPSERLPLTVADVRAAVMAGRMGGTVRPVWPPRLSWVLIVDTYSRWELRDASGVRWGWAVNAADGGRWTAHVGDFGQAATIGGTPPPFEGELLTVATAREARSWIEERIATIMQSRGLERPLP